MINIREQQTASADKNEDLHGNAPDPSTAALLLIDVVNDLDFPNNEEIVRNSGTLGERIAALKRRCKEARIPVIYVNDNCGKWRSDLGAVQRIRCVLMRPAAAWSKN